MEREEIHCAHVFCVLKHLGMRDMPRCCVAVRWTLQAKDGFEPDSNSSTHVWSEQMDRFRELRNMANTYLFRASMSAEESRRAVDFFKSIPHDDADNDDNADGEENDEKFEGRTFGPLPAYFHRPTKLLLAKSRIQYLLNIEVLHVRRGLNHSTRDYIPGTKVFSDGLHGLSSL